MMRDLTNLDVVRSIAVISVVVEHTLLALRIHQIGPYRVENLGVLGVLVFFVLTALVLMWSLERKPHTLDFYIRRCFRIYPLALFVIGMALLFHAPTGGTPKHYFAYTAPGLRSLASQASLLVPKSSHLVTVMWSLPLEMIMYVLLPALFFFVQKNFALWPLLLLFGLVILLTHDDPASEITFAVAIGYFLPGIMAYVGFGRWRALLPGWLLLAFLACLWATFLYHFDFHKSWWFCLIFGLGLPLFRQIRTSAIVIPSQYIAKYSYGIYLLHPFAIVIGLYLLRGHSLPVRLLGEVVPLVVLPVLAYHLLEHPMIRLGSVLAAKAERTYEQMGIARFRVAR